jgi:hypothetical protein
MQLLALTPAEIAFLSAPDVTPDSLHVRFTHKLAATLTACLRVPVKAHMQAATARFDPVSGTPGWQPDGALSTLWLVRRLGGQRVTGAASFVPKGLLQTLDAALAECWLDAPATTLPPVLAWQISSPLGEAGLVLQLPLQATDMTRWAREVIQHVR